MRKGDEMMGSQISGFYKMSIEERLKIIKEKAGLSEEDLKSLADGLPLKTADMMVENLIGELQVPLGIAAHFRVNGRDYLIPMATEEASVVAAASHAAKLALPEGFHTSSTRPVMRGQIQIVDLKDTDSASKTILASKKELIEQANRLAGSLPALGGGVIDMAVKSFQAPKKMLIVEFFIDCRDAMGANAVDMVVEGIAPEIESMVKGRALLKILSNLATERMVKAKVTYKSGSIGGPSVVAGVVDAYNFAVADPYRAATNNKGIMNGISAIALATGNDTRAVEAGAHAFASLTGKYMPLSKWWKDKNGDIVGELEMPLAVGIVGGVTKTHPVAQLALKILGVKSATELAEVACALGLAQNFAALRALVTEGIQKGHMELHARNVAVMAGASGDQIETVAEMLVKEKNVKVSRAKEILLGFQ
jgi:hydroxymethylglutaryl-CoA reductase